MKKIIKAGIYYVLTVAICYGVIIASLWLTITAANGIFNRGYSIGPDTALIMLVATAIYVLLAKVGTFGINKILKHFGKVKFYTKD